MAKKQLKYLKPFRKLQNDITYCRLERMIREMNERDSSPLHTGDLLAVECDDGVVVLSLEEKGFSVFMVKEKINLPDFRLNLTEVEMQEFNGGRGIRSRFMFYHKKCDEQRRADNG